MAGELKIATEAFLKSERARKQEQVKRLGLDEDSVRDENFGFINRGRFAMARMVDEAFKQDLISEKATREEGYQFFEGMKSAFEEWKFAFDMKISAAGNKARQAPSV